LYTAYGTAKTALEAAKAGSKTVLGLADYIAKHAGDLIDVKNFHISGSLQEIEKGNLFDADLNVAVLGRNYNWSIDYNVKDAAAFIEATFKKALDAAKKIAGV